jgi:hypothetical protein
MRLSTGFLLSKLYPVSFASHLSCTLPCKEPVARNGEIAETSRFREKRGCDRRDRNFADRSLSSRRSSVSNASSLSTMPTYYLPPNIVKRYVHLFLPCLLSTDLRSFLAVPGLSSVFLPPQSPCLIYFVADPRVSLQLGSHGSLDHPSLYVSPFTAILPLPSPLSRLLLPRLPQRQESIQMDRQRCLHSRSSTDRRRHPRCLGQFWHGIRQL